jgi:hypothetical protein
LLSRPRIINIFTIASILAGAFDPFVSISSYWILHVVDGPLLVGCLAVAGIHLRLMQLCVHSTKRQRGWEQKGVRTHLKKKASIPSAGQQMHTLRISGWLLGQDVDDQAPHPVAQLQAEVDAKRIVVNVGLGKV